MGRAVILASSYDYNSSQFYVRDPSNSYTDISSTTRTEISSYNYNTNPYYVYMRGFNFSGVIPSGMVALSTSVSINLDFYQGLESSSDYYPMLCNGATVISDTPTKNGNIYTFADIDWDTISGYGSNFGIRLCLKKSYAYASTSLYIYGAQIDIEYGEAPSGQDTMFIKLGGAWIQASAVYKKVNGSWVNQSDLTTVFEDGINYKLN